MHIPDGAVCPYTCLVTYAIMIPAWYISTKKSATFLKKDINPLIIALGTAFTFAIMMFNVPIPYGTTGHAIGAALLSILFGPWVSSMLVTIALLVQAVVFGDGGLTTFAANSLIIAFIPSFSGYYLFNFLNRNKSGRLLKQTFIAGIAGYVSITLAALSAGFILGIQPYISFSNSGEPLHFFYPLSVTIPAMLSEHIVLFGWVEAVVTASVFALLSCDIQFNKEILMKRGINETSE